MIDWSWGNHTIELINAYETFTIFFYKYSEV